MESESFLDFDTLHSLAQRTDAVSHGCACDAPALDAWTSLPASYPEQQLDAVGTLVRDPYAEASFEEYHPEGTNIWSAEAPIAPLYYPYNRCTVWECRVCQRAYLRYVEAGGYFVDARIRRLRADRLVDRPLPG